MLQFRYQNKVPPFSYQASFEANRGRSRAEYQGAGGQHNFLVACTLLTPKNLQMSSHTSPLCLWKSTWPPEIWPWIRLAWLLSAERNQGPWRVEDGCCGIWDVNHSLRSQHTLMILCGGKKNKFSNWNILVSPWASCHPSSQTQKYMGEAERFLLLLSW